MFSGNLGPTNLAVLALLGGVVLWTLQLIYGARRHKGYDPIYVGLNVAGWILVFLGVAPFFSVSFLGFPLLGALLVVAALTVDRYRKAERKSLLWALAVAAEKGYPLAPAARAFADERSDELGRRTHHLADLLEQGAALELALLESGNPLPPEGMLAIRVHSESGALATALHDAAANDSGDDPVWDNLIERLIYLVILYGTAAMVVIGIMLFIVPTFEEIFIDFDMELPAATQLVISWTHATAKFAYIRFLPWMLLILFLIVGVFYYVGWIEWELPFIHWWFRGFETSRVLRLMAVGVEKRYPLDKLFMLAAGAYPRPLSAAALSSAAEEVKRGASWIDALAQAGFLTDTDAGLLRSSERTGSIAWALREIADAQRRRIIERLNVVSSIVVPMLILMIAIPIGLLAIGMIQPLAMLIWSLAR